MPDVLISTISALMAATNSANVTSSSITEPTPTTTAPSGDGVFSLGHNGQFTTSGVKLVFFGVGSDSNTFSAYVYGWEVQKALLANKVDVWVPALLCTFTSITLDSTQPWPSNGDFATTNYFATAITLGVGNSGISVEVVSPGHASHEIAHAVISTKGPRYMEVRFATGSSATSCNALWKRV